MVSRFLTDSFLLCHGLVMTVFDWSQDEKGRYLYCHQKIGTAIAVIWHCIAHHPSEKVQLLWPSSSNPHVRYKTLKFRIHGYDAPKAPTACETFLTCKK